MAQWPCSTSLTVTNYQRVSNNISRHSSAAETSAAAQPVGYHWITFFCGLKIQTGTTCRSSLRIFPQPLETMGLVRDLHLSGTI